MKPIKIREEKIKLLLTNSSYTLEQIAKEVNVDFDTVRAVCQKLKIDLKERGYLLTKLKNQGNQSKSPPITPKETMAGLENMVWLGRAWK